MFGIKIMSKKRWSEFELNHSKEIRELLDSIGNKIEELKFQLNTSKLENNRLNKHLNILNASNRLSINKEQFLRKELIELVESFHAKELDKNISNENLIVEFRGIYNELFKSNMQQFQLLVDMSEKADISTIGKIRDYVESCS
jgi:hypothetical protein